MLKRKMQTVILNLFFVMLVLIIALPVVWMIMNSFKTNIELLTDSLALPQKLYLDNFVKAWNKGLYQYFGNSLIVSITSLVFILSLSALLAYGITRFNTKYGTVIFLIVLGGMALSEQVALVPLYRILKKIKLYNTYLAVILPYISFRIPFTVFLMRSYFLSIPKELEEAAVIDGYNSFQIFMKIIVPISKPIFASCAIVNLNFVWNEFLFANIFLESKSLMTIPIGLMTFKGDMRSDYAVMLAGITIASAPLIILYLCMQNQFVKGLTAGAVKG